MLRHIGFIMDGNGRWAESHGMARSEGYRYGLEALKRVLDACRELNVEAVTAYAFSTENFSRPADETSAVFDVVKAFNNSYEGDMRVLYMGDIDSLPREVAESVDSVERRTRDNDGMTLNIALAYGGRADILSAAKRCYDNGEFTDDAFEKYLSSSALPPLDLVVRTGGEKRLSNFMLYEAAYSELIFLDKLWCDMRREDVLQIFEEYDRRTRKFGR